MRDQLSHIDLIDEEFLVAQEAQMDFVVVRLVKLVFKRKNPDAVRLDPLEYLGFP